MEDLSKFCFICMGEKNADGICPNCGNAEVGNQEYPLLPLGSMVGGRYYIGKATRKNSDGITYTAYDTKEMKKCSVREFFPDGLSARGDDGVTVIPALGCDNIFGECLSAFLELWKKLMRLKGLTSLINIYDIFTTENTAYAVFSETENITLRSHLLSTQQGFMEWEQARILFMPVLSTLGTLHTSGVIHKGIDPDSFIFTDDGKLKLSNFSIPQARLAWSGLNADISDGYAPLEIYSEDGNIGAWTDIYSFTAVLYRTLIGTTPISAKIRAQNDQMLIPARFAEKLPPYVINALINGMQLSPADRTRNAEQLRSNLSASPRAVGASASVYKVKPGEIRSAGRSTPPVQPKNPPVADPPQPRADRRTQSYDKLSDNAQRAFEEQQKKAKARKRLTGLLVAIIALLLVGIALIVSAMFGASGHDKQTTTEPPVELQTVNIPNFVGSQYDSIASDTYYTQSLRIVKTEESSIEIPSGQIIRQSIPSGTTVTTGTEIILTVSSGPKKFAVPDVTGKTYEEALAVLAQEGLNCIKASKYNDGTHEADHVAETFPPAGSEITQGDDIQIILWSSLPESDVVTDENGNPIIAGNELHDNTEPENSND
ncbi:MAG: PASTA domain-containing protein [Oscillospiraceae bacterium]|nr:PASTA domain-containing protein [Oscillospiraceae bacterium]